VTRIATRSISSYQHFKQNRQIHCILIGRIFNPIHFFRIKRQNWIPDDRAMLESAKQDERARRPPKEGFDLRASPVDFLIYRDIVASSIA